MTNDTSCRRCNSLFRIGVEDLEFYRLISPSFQSIIQEIPPPTLCPDCRLQRRLAFRNERHLYKRRSCLSNAEMISIFSPSSPFTVCSYDEWWGDRWDPLTYGRPVDLNRSFTDQLLELSRAVPHCPLYIRNGQNSDYTNYCLNIKDCYLIFGSTDCEHCLYSKSLSHCRDVLDSLAVLRSEVCYEGIASEKCYQCSFFNRCTSCTDCFMVEACESCTNCALCFGLYRKEYCVLNEYVGKARYDQFIASLAPLSWQRIGELKRQLIALKQTLPHRAVNIMQSEGCTGDNIYQSKNCVWCFDINGCESCKYLFWTPKGLRSYDCCFNAPDGVELCYEVCSTLGSRTMAAFMSWNNDSAYFCIECHYNRDIFGCIGLRHKQYCILNKQYSKEEYEQLVPEIITQLRITKEWGEYLPEKLSMFGYNETIAQEYFPLEKDLAISRGFLWVDEEISTRRKNVNSSVVPETIAETDQSIVDKTLVCELTGRQYKITPTELDFYRKRGIPVPRLSPNERHARRLAQRNPLTLWEHRCAKTGQSIWSNYPLDSTFPIYSSDAYRDHLYGSG